MRTGKHQFNYKRYAIIWANKIMSKNDKYSIEKAYSIDKIFGMLVEEYLAILKKLDISTKMTRLAILQAYLEGLQKEFKVINEQINKSISNVEDMMKDYLNMSDKEYNEHLEEFKNNWDGKPIQFDIDYDSDIPIDLEDSIMKGLSIFSIELDNMTKQIDTLKKIAKIKKGDLDD